MLFSYIASLLLVCFSWHPDAVALTNPGYRGLSYVERPTVNTGAPGGVQVNTQTGNLVLQRGLFAIPGKGLPVDFSLTYNSDHRLVSSPFGYGWNLSYNIRYTKDSSGNVTVVWGDGRQDTFSWDGSTYTALPGVYMTLTADGAGQLTLTTKYGIRFRFADPTHRKLTALEDPNGNTLTFGYDASARLTAITDAGGRVYTLTYDPSGKVTQITDPQLGARAFTLAYDASGRLTGITDPLGNSETFGYDAENLITSLTDPRGTTTTITYTTPAWDATTRLPATVAKGGSTTSFAYDATQKTTTVTDPNGHAWQYAYDTNGTISRITDPLGQSTTFTWNSTKDLTRLTDRNTHTTTFTYDSTGNLLTLTDALGNTRTWTYEPNFNRVASFTDRRGHTWSHVYDAHGNRTKTTDPLGNTFLRSFDAAGQMTTYTDGNGHTTTFTYDGYGNNTTMTDPLGNQIQGVYDAGSRPVQITDRNGNSTTLAYDALDRLTGVTDPLGHADTRTYDANGNLVAFTDRNGNTTTLAYDALNRLTSSTDPLGHADARTYDANGNLTAYTDRNGHDWLRVYDPLNRLISRSDPLGNTWQYAYDANSNLVSYTDALGQVTTNTYDGLNRLTQQTFADSTTATYTYDANGNLLSAEDASSHYTFTYDALNRKIQYSDILLGKAVSYAYDPVGNLISKTGPEGDVVTYGYDAADNLVSVAEPSGTTTYTYDADGNRVSTLYASGVTSTFTYDAANRLASIVHKDPAGAVLASFVYTRDAMGRIVRSDLENGKYNRFFYDALGRIIEDDEISYFNNGTPVWTIENYAYDANGNKTSYIQSGVNGTITWDAANRPLQDTGWGAAGATFTYDANGNRTQMQEISSWGLTQDYAYDARGRMSTVSVSGWTTGTYTYTYDVFNRLIKVDNGNGMVQRIMYGSPGPIAEYDGNGKNTAKFHLDEYLKKAREWWEKQEVAHLEFGPNGEVKVVGGRSLIMTVDITKDNPGNETGQDLIYHPLPGDTFNDWGNRILADLSGNKDGDIPHNSRGEWDMDNPDLVFPQAYTPTLEGWWHGWPWDYNAMWPAGGHINPWGLVQDPWTGARVANPQNPPNQPILNPQNPLNPWMLNLQNPLNPWMLNLQNPPNQPILNPQNLLVQVERQLAPIFSPPPPSCASCRGWPRCNVSTNVRSRPCPPWYYPHDPWNVGRILVFKGWAYIYAINARLPEEVANPVKTLGKGVAFLAGGLQGGYAAHQQGQGWLGTVIRGGAHGGAAILLLSTTGGMGNLVDAWTGWGVTNTLAAPVDVVTTLGTPNPAVAQNLEQHFLSGKAGTIPRVMTSYGEKIATQTRAGEVAVDQYSRGINAYNKGNYVEAGKHFISGTVAWSVSAGYTAIKDVANWLGL
jgi:YD repeat-containing protein